MYWILFISLYSVGLSAYVGLRKNSNSIGPVVQEDNHCEFCWLLLLKKRKSRLRMGICEVVILERLSLPPVIAGMSNSSVV